MSEVEITSKRILSVWWLLSWRATAGGAVLGGIGGFVYGVVMALTGHPRHSPLGGAIVGYLLAFPWSFIVVGMALRKRYRDFRIVLMAYDPAESGKL